MFNYVKFKFLKIFKFCIFLSFALFFTSASNGIAITEAQKVNTIDAAMEVSIEATQLPNVDNIKIFEAAFVSFSGSVCIKIGISTFLYYVEQNDLDRAANRLIEILSQGEYEKIFKDEKYGMDKFYSIFENEENKINIFFRKDILALLNYLTDAENSAKYNEIFNKRLKEREVNRNNTTENQSSSLWSWLFG